MNEMSSSSFPQSPEFAMSKDAPPAPHELPVPRMSPDIGELGVALLQLQGKLFSPIRNKTATITPKGKVAYTFRYTSLDALNEMLREPMTECGLVFLHLPAMGWNGREILFTRLLHVASKQWIECVLPLNVEKDAMVQAFGSALSYMRRYATVTMLGIASEDDLDGAAASGNGFQDHGAVAASGEDADRRQGRLLGERFTKLVHSANHTTSPETLLDLLKLWHGNTLLFCSMRDKPINANDWATAVSLVSEALTRVHGAPIGAVWRRMLSMRTLAELAELREAWREPELTAARHAMKAMNEPAYALFCNQLNTHASRVEDLAAAEPDERPVAGPAVPADEVPPATQASAVPVEAVSPPPPELPPSPPSLEAAAFQLLDEAGDAMGEPIGDRGEWARQYCELLGRCNHEEGDALAEHNADAIAWCAADPAAVAILDAALVPSPAPPPESTSAPAAAPTAACATSTDGTQPALAPGESTPPAPAGQAQLALVPTRVRTIPLGVGRAGGPDVMAYNAQVRKAVAALTREELLPWMSANAQVYTGAPQAMRLKVLGYLAERARQLGTTLPAQGE